MSATQLSLATCPRDPAELAKVGRFNLRMLGEEAGIFATEAGKSAYMGMSSEQQAENLLKIINEKEGKGKGGGQPTRSPTTKGTGKTSGTSPSKPAGTTATGSGGAAGGTGGTGGTNIGPLLEKLDELLNAVNGVSERVSSVEGAISDLQNFCGGTNRLAVIAIGAACKLAEEVMQAGPAQVLKAVIDDMAVVEDAIKSVVPSLEETGDEEEEQDEGNGE